MASSADNYILSRIAELAKRFNLMPSEADAELSYNDSKAMIEFPNIPIGFEKNEQFSKMLGALGCSEEAILTADSTFDMEAIVENALRKAPRARKL